MTKLGDQIQQLRTQGLTYKEISNQLKCSKGTVAYHCGEGQKNKSFIRSNRFRNKQHPFYRRLHRFLSDDRTKSSPRMLIVSVKLLLKGKIECFTYKKTKEKYMQPKFTVEDVIQKFGENTTCYLTGDTIDINKPRSYAFDHIIPRTRGGNNDLDNLGICTKEVNQAKSDMTPDEFMNLCKKVLEYNGYTVTK